MKKSILYILIVLLIASLVGLVYLFVDNNKLQADIKDYKLQIKELNNNDENNDKTDDTSNLDDTKSCTYTETYQFLDYYENDNLFSSESTFNIILEKFQSKNGPKIESLNKSTFDKNFVKGKNYEITYKKTVTFYNGNTYESYNILDIKLTDKEGLDQIQENCKYE